MYNLLPNECYITLQMANILCDALKNYYKQNASKLFQDYVNEGRVGTKHPEADP